LKLRTLNISTQLSTNYCIELFKEKRREEKRREEFCVDLKYKKNG